MVRSRGKAQILVTTLLVLLLVILTILTIASTAGKNSQQTVSNLEYNKAYNYAESKILQAATILSNPSLDYLTIETKINTVPGFDTCDVTSKAICSFSETEPGRRTILQISDVNYLDNFELANEEYFDIVLTNGGTGYRGSITMNWKNTSAIELSLIFKDAVTNELKQATQIIDPSHIYDLVDTSRDFLLTNPLPNAALKEAIIELGNLRTTEIPNNAVLRVLRLKIVTRGNGDSINVRPTTNPDPTFPNQVRRVESFSYNTVIGSSSVPVVVTQLPLSPQMPNALTYGLNLAALRFSMCGDGLKSPREQCDDGNADNTDLCTNVCNNAVCGDTFIQPGRGENCDDGNTNNNDGCSASCKIEYCGDGIKQTAEACDDGNAVNGDGCETNCKVTVPPPPPPPTCTQGRICCAPGPDGSATLPCTGSCSGDTNYPKNEDCAPSGLVSSGCCV